ncbi:DUF7408 domain-containing protein [Paenibacillus azoreducens]|uniref:DUF7408 domain-containing protein n=1 Tax=Paenibacillus azoreducens TaxID=116718 RepID=A0A919YGG5_9BACL|nr:hypothetical protein [Paenibacillus azoreducens]GIO48255.1 hypothetical protein J34TS1_30200 [Paenibacillus azoreducens]
MNERGVETLSLRNKDLKRIRLPIGILALLMLFQLGLAAGIVHADNKPSIEMTSQVGYNRMIKEGAWNPLKLTLTSNQDLSGDIVVQVMEDRNGNSPISYVQHVELPKDTVKEVLLTIPGQPYNKRNNTVIFYEGSVEKGKQIPFSNGDGYIQGATFNSANVAVLSDDPDAMNFLALLQSGNSKVSVMHMKQQDIPDNPMLLDGIDVLVLTRFASDTLTPQQVKAIEEWVKTGGHLVLGGGATYPKTAGPFSDISPVKYKGTFSTSSLPELEKLGAYKQGSEKGGAAKLNLGGEVTLSDAELVKEAKLLYAAGGKPLFASRQVENGKVLYAAYDVTQEPIASWPGHPSVWSSLLSSELQKSNWNAMRGNYNPMLNLSYILNFFPSLKMPSFQALAWLILIYAIVVAPLLYWILKKADKREWAWWMIPTIAVIASGTVYFIGAADKTKEMSHTLNVVELDGSGQGKMKSATAFFSPGSGNYHLEFPANSYVSVQREGGSFSGSNNSRSLVEMGSKETGVKLLDMAQWSLAKLWVEQRSQMEALGKFDVSLFINDKGTIDGSVVNSTSKKLDHAGLVVGGKLYPLGSLDQGKSVSLASVTTAKSFANGNLSFALFQGVSGNGQDPFVRERGMIDNYMMASSWSAKDAYVLGFSKDKLFNYLNDGHEIDSNQLNLWVQPVNISWIQKGKLNIPFGFVSPTITQSSGSWYVEPNGISHIEQGYIMFDYDAPDMKKMTGGTMKLQTKNPGKQTEYSIFNYQKQDWEPIVWGTSKQWSTANPNEKYASQGHIRIKLSAKEATDLVLPELAVEGAVKP